MAIAPPKYKEGSNLLGHIGPFSKDPVGFMTQLHEHQSPSIGFRMATINAVYLTNPDDIQEVMKKPKVFIKGGIQQNLARKILGNGLAMSNGDFWARQRRIMGKGFRPKAMAGYIDLFYRVADTYVTKWLEQGQDTPYDVLDDLNRATMDAAVGALFGTSVNYKDQEVILDSIKLSLTEINRRLSKGDLLPMWVPTAKNRELKQSMQAFEDIIMQVIEEKSQQQEAGHTILEMLLMTVDEETGEQMDLQQIVDEARIMFVAGTDTSASTLSWALHHLATDAAVMAKVQAEIDAWQAAGAPRTIEALMGLKYLQAVIHESMRMYPPAWMLVRYTSENTELGPYAIKKGTNIFFSAYLQHRDPQIWENPQEFRPERFMEPLTEVQEKAYFPFTSGPRKCIGFRFALLEMACVLSELFSRASIAAPEGFAPQMDFLATIRPEPGILLQFTPKG